MNFFKLAVTKPVAVTVILLGIVALGLIYAPMINIESFPQIEVPVASVITSYPGAGPGEIEEQVTKPIEEQVGSISGIKQISSTSIENVSIVIAEFNYGTNMDTAMADIREKLDLVKHTLPEDAKTPAASAVNPSASPILILSFFGEEDSKKLRSIAENDIKPLIEQLPGVGSVTVSGGMERMIQVAVDKDKMEAVNVSPFNIISALKQENINLPAGKIIGEYQQFNLRTKGEFTSLKDIEKVPVAVRGGVPVYISDIAEVIDSHKEIKTISRFTDNSDKEKGAVSVGCVTIEIRRNEDANIVKVAKLIKKRIEGINKDLPAGAGIYVAYDSSVYIEEAIRNLADTAVEGAILAILVLFLFLGSVRSTFVISLSIPISIIGTFLIMYFTNVTINMITLTALILGIGRIVDDSIVVLENIFRYMEEGYDAVSAAIEGTKEVGLAITASTFTTISVFFPLFLIQGIAGQIFTPLSKTFAYAILMSLLVSVTAVPMLCARFLKDEAERKESRNFIDKFLASFNKLFESLSAYYRKVLSWALNNRKKVVLIAAGSFIASFLMLPFIPVTLMEKWDRGDFIVNIETPQGSSLSRTDELVKRVEKRITDTTPGLKAIISYSGKSAGQSRMSLGSGSGQPHIGGMTVSLVPKEKRKKSVYKIMKELEDSLSKMAGGKITVREEFSITGKKPIAINIKGNDLSKLTSISGEILDKIKNIKGLKNIDLNWREGAPEYQFIIDRRKVADLGLGYGNVASVIRQLVAEDKVTVYREDGDEYDIVLQLPQEERSKIKDIMKMKIITPSGKKVPLGSIAELKLTTGPSEIPRKDRIRYISIESDLQDGATLLDAKKKIMPVLKEYRWPAGYTWDIGGEEKERQEIFGQMYMVLWLAILFVYIILAVQFESFIHPLTIMLAIPLELFGVFLMFLITGSSITMFGLLGIIMLTGIVVSNSILLVNYIIVLRGRGMDRNDAILKAGPVRLRPILMTAASTMVAMIPLALGLRSGAEIFSTLAKGVIGGLITSTFLTLLVVPVVYSLFDEIGPRMKKAYEKITGNMKNRFKK
ncbi:MAG: efflux RND transporter permease subunit [Armatimonadota bacterium]